MPETMSNVFANHLVSLLSKESKKPYRRYRKDRKQFTTWDCIKLWGCCNPTARKRMKKLAEHGYLIFDPTIKPFVVTLP